MRILFCYRPVIDCSDYKLDYILQSRGSGDITNSRKWSITNSPPPTRLHNPIENQIKSLFMMQLSF